jgi:hypothetical protein
MCYVGNTTNLRNHLRVHHVTEYVAIEKQQNAEVPEKKSRQAMNQTSTSADGTKPMKQVQLQQSSLQSSFAKFESNHPKQVLITEKIALMICKDLQPYSIVEDAGFRAVLMAAEPRYVMPSRKTFSDEVIPKMHAKSIDAVKSEIHDAASIAFTTDAWTSRANQSYLSYTAHFLTPEFVPRNYCLAVENCDESHTADNLV